MHVREQIIRLFQIIDRREFERLPECFHREIVYERPGYLPYVGIDSLINFYRNIRVVTAGRHQIESICADDNVGACWGRFVGTKRDGTCADLQYADVYRFQDNRVVFRRSYFYLQGV